MNTASGFPDPLVSDTPLPFHELCTRINDRIAAFLDVKDISDRVKNVQEQTHTSLKVIEEALDKYRLVLTMWGTVRKLGTDSYVVYRSSPYRIMAAKTASFFLYYISALCIEGV
jgi:hypothetical protein